MPTLDVAIIDVPTVRAFGIAAAGEGEHGAIEPRLSGPRNGSRSCDTSHVGADLSPGRFCHKTLKLRRIFRPVTAEAAGSSPVSRASLLLSVQTLGLSARSIFRLLVSNFPTLVTSLLAIRSRRGSLSRE